MDFGFLCCEMIRKLSFGVRPRAAQVAILHFATASTLVWVAIFLLLHYQDCTFCCASLRRCRRSDEGTQQAFGAVCLARSPWRSRVSDSQ